jgi:hypothetical protein
MRVQVQRAPRQPMLGGWLGPLIAGGVLAAAVVAGALAARARGAEGLGMFALAAIVLCAIWYVCLLVDARKVEGAQFKIYLIPLYFLFYIYGQSENRYLRTVTPAVLMGILSLVVLAIEYDRNPKPKRQPQTMWVDRPSAAPSPNP